MRLLSFTLNGTTTNPPSLRSILLSPSSVTRTMIAKLSSGYLYYLIVLPTLSVLVDPFSIFYVLILQFQLKFCTPLQADSYYGSSGSLRDELIARLPHIDAIYKIDNVTIYMMIEKASRGTSVKFTVKTFCTS